MTLKRYFCALALNSALIGNTFAMQPVNGDDFERCVMANNTEVIGRFFDGEAPLLNMPSQQRFDELFERAYEDNPTLASYLLSTPDRYMKPTQRSVDRVYQKAATSSDVHFMHRLATTIQGTPKPSQSIVNEVFFGMYDSKNIDGARTLLSTSPEILKPTVSIVTSVFERAVDQNDVDFMSMLLTTPNHAPKPSRKVVSDTLAYKGAYHTIAELRHALLSIPNITNFLAPNTIHTLFKESLISRDFVLIQQLIEADQGRINVWKYELPSILKEMEHGDMKTASVTHFVADLLSEKIDESILSPLEGEKI